MARKLLPSSKYLLPAVAAGAAGLAIFYVTKQGSNYKHRHPPIPASAMRPRGPVAISHVVSRLKQQCHNYIKHAAIDKTDVHRKNRLVSATLHDHCHRILPRYVAHGSHPHYIGRVCESICEKVCNQLNIHLKPRCSNMMVGQHLPHITESRFVMPHLPKYHAHALYAVNMPYYLDYSHTPTPNYMGRLL